MTVLPVLFSAAFLAAALFIAFFALRRAREFELGAFLLLAIGIGVMAVGVVFFFRLI